MRKYIVEVAYRSHSDPAFTRADKVEVRAHTGALASLEAQALVLAQLGPNAMALEGVRLVDFDPL